MRAKAIHYMVKGFLKSLRLKSAQKQVHDNDLSLILLNEVNMEG